jgi:hypothetical protein
MVADIQFALWAGGQLRRWFGLGLWVDLLLVAVSFAGHVFGGRICHNT